ncbi:MAG: hypothetical protein ACI915_001802 [Gammaproteobacteria bacterium]|jgi:hypothetical protein
MVPGGGAETPTCFVVAQWFPCRRVKYLQAVSRNVIAGLEFQNLETVLCLALTLPC